MKYSFKIGLSKSLKNVLWTYVLPAVVLLLSSYSEWLPSSTAVKAAPFIAFITYLIKNYVQNK